MLTLAEIAVSNWVLGLAVMGFFLVCLLLVLTILIQRPQGGGLAGAFGSGAGSGQTAFGAKTGDALTMFTIGVFVLYIVAAILLNLYLKPAELPTDAAAATGAPTTETSGATPAPGTAPAGEQPQVPFQPPASLTPAGTTEVKPAPAPGEPAPTPADPAPVQPAPVQPAPAQPAPTEPAPEQPKPATP